MNTRLIALENIISILEDNKPLHIVLRASLSGIDDPKDRSFTARLTRGCVERKITLDHIIDSFSNTKTEKQKPVIRNILRIGVYQVFFMDSSKEFAVCNESVKLAVKKGFGNLKGFVNAILRNICRNKNDLCRQLEKEYPLNIKYSIPEWIVNEFCERYGKEKAESVFSHLLIENPVSIRVNISKTDPESIKNELDKITTEGFSFERNRYIDKCFNLSGTGSIESFDSFKTGLFVVQDFSSVLVGEVIRSVMGSDSRGKALDLCAAPGGKSLHLADMGYDVTACDISDNKLKQINDSVIRCGFENIKIIKNDALIYNNDFENSFDIVLCDLPCSGLGVIGKKPDLKYNMTESKSLELADMQRKILSNSVKYLKKGGLFVYSTCTVRKCENEDNAGFIRESLGLKGIPVGQHLPPGVTSREDTDCYIQILPGEYQSDGFFISCFRKEEG